MIIVGIPTKNRGNKLIRCLKAVINGKQKPNLIIVIDQSNDNIFEKNKNYIKQLKFDNLIHIKQKKIGVSKARNLAIEFSNKISTKINKYIAFLDDDCIPDKKWLKIILDDFKSNQKPVAIFGRTKAFIKTKAKNTICPCTFEKQNKAIFFSKPIYHATNIGFGNNMAFKLDILKKIKFKTWLGPGSIGSNAEDAEIIFNLLSNKYIIMHDPKIIVYHDKWLSTKQYKKSLLSYDHGEIVCYGYYALRGSQLAKKIVIQNFSNSLNITKKYLKTLKIGEVIFNMVNIANKTKAFTIAFYFWIKEKYYFESSRSIS